MQTLEQANKGAVDPRFAGPLRIYWLAFLLTGRREPSVDATLEALDVQNGANPFFSTWMLAWSRRVVIAKALAAIRDDLAESVRRTLSKRAKKAAPLPRNWALDPATTRLQLEKALLAIELFPRCALLLSFFEGVSLDDTAILLDVERDVVRKAHMIGLRELIRNLARRQSHEVTRETQYA